MHWLNCFLALGLVFLNAGTCAAFDGPASAAVERVVDGDTIRVRVEIWLDQELSVAVRVAEIDAPELFRPECAAEKALAEEAKEFVIAFLGTDRIVLKNIRYGKYAGRVVADVYAREQNLGEALIEAGLAVSGANGPWCVGV